MVLCGSALIGPDEMLPIRPGEPVAMQALCLSPIHAGVTGSMNGSLSSKLAFVSTHLIWTHLLEPPNSLCEDVSISDSEAFRKALERREKDMKEGCAIGCRLPSFDAYVDEARYVEPQGERMTSWHEYALDHMTCPFLPDLCPPHEAYVHLYSFSALLPLQSGRSDGRLPHRCLRCRLTSSACLH